MKSIGISGEVLRNGVHHAHVVHQHVNRAVERFNFALDAVVDVGTSEVDCKNLNLSEQINYHDIIINH